MSYFTNKPAHAPNSWKRWTVEEDQFLINAYISKLRLSDIIKKLSRTERGVRQRLQLLNRRQNARVPLADTPEAGA